MKHECERCGVELIEGDHDGANCESKDQDLCDFCQDEGYIGSSAADALYDAWKHGDFEK